MACHIEKASEIPDSFYNLEKVGITAGASTPDCVIEEVESKLIAK
jgi:4-hydroxy-3-methylbut-2-enyl diphosphate reductase